jgi:DNA-binding beta-propeller fold protein YncE
MNAMPLRLIGHVELPANKGSGGFDHAAVHAASGHVHVAHTANDAVDVFDPASGKYLYSVPGLTGVAGAFVSDEGGIVISSNRGENTIGVFAPGRDPEVQKIAVGVKPNGLAYDPARRLVLVANVGDPAIAGSHTLSMVKLDERRVTEIAVPGRTRWTVFDPDAQRFHVNIADPAEIVIVDARRPDAIAGRFAVPAGGPHGLDLDRATHRLFCACDDGTLVTLDSQTGKVLGTAALSGTPDVVFFNAVRRQLYVAVGDPGVIDVFDTATMQVLGRIATEKGAHTIAFAPSGDRVYAFLPQTHRAAIFDVATASPRQST